MDKVKIGFIGCGFMGQLAHLSNYSTLQDCEVVALTERKKDLGKRVAAKYGVPGVYTDYREMIRESVPDALVMTKRYEHHLALLPEVLSYKLPVMIEKPLCVGWESGEKLCALAQEYGTPIAVGYHKRSDPAVEYARKTIREWQETGICGALRYVRITMPPGDWIQNAAVSLLQSTEPVEPVSQENVPGQFTGEDAAGYQKMVNYYIHQFNLMRFLMGEPYTIEYVDKQEIILVVNGHSGTSGIIEMSPYTTRNDWQEKAMICFEKGWIEVEIPAPMVERRAGSVRMMTFDQSGEPVITQPILPALSAMRNQAIRFVKMVRGERTDLCTCEEALEDLYMARDYMMKRQITR
jgi:predicted dehydrogenase